MDGRARAPPVAAPRAGATCDPPDRTCQASPPLWSRSRRTVPAPRAAHLGLGAGSRTAPPPAEPARRRVRTSGDVTLSLWTHDQGYEAFFRKGIPGADRATDFRYQLKVTRAGAADLVTKLLAQAVAGRGTPDLMGFEIGSFPRMLRGDIAQRLLHDFTADIAAVPGLKDDLLPARIAPYSRTARVYALDSDTPMVVYYYRDDLFDRVRAPEGDQTWEEFAEAGARVYRDHGHRCASSPRSGSDSARWCSPSRCCSTSAAARSSTPTGTCGLDSPEAEEVLRFLCEGLRSGFVMDVADYYGAAMQTALKQGRVIGLPMAIWYKNYGLMPNVPEQKGKWRIRALPRFAAGGGATAALGGTGFGVITDKANTRAATDFLFEHLAHP